MSVTLPTSPPPREFEIFPVRRVAILSGGGADQQVNRSGERSEARITLPPVPMTDVPAWQADLRVTADTFILNIPESGISIGSPGTPLVNGGSQTGSSLITDGWTASHVIAKGKWLSISVSGLLYLYQVKAAVTANGSGQATLSIQPPLRTSPADNAALNVNPAKIEGFLELPDGALAITVSRLMEGCSFIIRERR